MGRNENSVVNFDPGARLWDDVVNGHVHSQDLDSSFRVLDLDELVRIAEVRAEDRSTAPQDEHRPQANPLPFQTQTFQHLPWDVPPLLRSCSPTRPTRSPPPPPPPPRRPIPARMQLIQKWTD